MSKSISVRSYARLVSQRVPDNAYRGLISTSWIRQLVIRLLNNWSQHLFDVAISLCVKETITCTDYVYVKNLPAAQFCSHKIFFPF